MMLGWPARTIHISHCHCHELKISEAFVFLGSCPEAASAPLAAGGSCERRWWASLLGPDRAMSGPSAIECPQNGQFPILKCFLCAPLFLF